MGRIKDWVMDIEENNPGATSSFEFYNTDEDIRNNLNWRVPKEDWFDVISAFGKLMNKTTTTQVARSFICTLEKFLFNSKDPSSTLEILSSSMRDPSFYLNTINCHLELIARLDPNDSDSNLQDIKRNLLEDKPNFESLIVQEQYKLLLYPQLCNINANSDYEANKNTAECEDNEFDEYDDYRDDYNDVYVDDSSRLIDQYGEDGFETDDGNFFPESWSPE